MSATEKKDEGNAKFKAGDFQGAIDAYTQSLEIDPKQHLCFSNRSFSYLKLGNCAAEALKDAERCVELAPEFMKGYCRQALALQALRRYEDAVAACERGLAVTGDDSLRKIRAEVKTFQFAYQLKGCWHGKVTEALGGYEQEMEFLEDSSVRVEVLGRSIVGRFWVDGNAEPKHLNIQVPMQDVPPGMPPPPPVPYIAKLDDKGLHLCCPYMKMERPTDFEGPGFVLMQQGSLTKTADASISNLSEAEKLLLCAQELSAVLPDQKIEDVSSADSEEDTRDKLMAQVKFESSMYAIQTKFGEETMKEVLSATKASPGSSDVPKALVGSAELNGLVAKLKSCGILDMADAPGQPAAAAATPASPARTLKTVRVAEDKKEEKGRAAEPSTDVARSGISPVTVGAIALGCAAAAALAMVLLRRQRH